LKNINKSFFYTIFENDGESWSRRRRRRASNNTEEMEKNVNFLFLKRNIVNLTNGLRIFV
jgi:hypothetical protein